MTDLPDWTTQQQAGGIRYVGSISVTIGGGGSGGGSLNVTLLPLDRSIIVVCPSRGAITTTTVDVLTNDPGVSPALFSTSAGVSSSPQPVNAYVSPAITSLWQVAVDMTGPPAGPFVFYVFVDSSVTHVAVDPGAASIPVGITSPVAGQGTMLQSLPVVIASDQSPVAVLPYMGTGGMGMQHTFAGITAGAPAFTFAGPLVLLAATLGVTYHIVNIRMDANPAGSMGVMRTLWGTTASAQIGQLVVSATVPTDEHTFQNDGYALPTGQGLQITVDSSVASQGGAAWVEYWTS